MTMSLRLSKLTVAALVAMFLLASVTDVAASHFRFGTITWQIENPSQPRVVKIRFDSAWRWSYAWPSPTSLGPNYCPGAPFVPTGDTDRGSCPPVGRLVYAVGVDPGLIVITGPPGSGPTGGTSRFSLPLDAIMEVRSINSAEDWMTATFEATVTLPNVPGNYEVEYENSARISTLTDGNADQPYRVASMITLRLPPNAINQPPTASTLPIIRVATNQTTSFVIPASDPNGDPISFRFATSAESGLVNTQPPGMTINQTTGMVTFTPANNGLFAPQFVVSDPFGAYTVVDLLVESRTATGQPPRVHINNTPGPKTFVRSANQALTFNVSTADPENTSVMLMGTGLPPGSTMSPSLPMVAPGNSSSNFNWTPTPAAIGTYILNFSALDGDGRQSFQTATIQVTSNQPTIQCLAPPPQALVATSPAGATVGLGANVTDADDDLLTVRIFIDDLLVATSPLLNPPTGFGNPPMPFAVGTHLFVMDVSDGVSPPAVCNGSFTVVDTGAPTLTVPANFSVPGTSPAGAVVSYVVSATDQVDTSVGISCMPASGSTFPYGPSVVSCTATDDSGNTDTDTFTVTVVDPTPPTITTQITGTLGSNDWYTSNVTVGFIGTDPESGIASSSGCAPTVVGTDTTGLSFNCSFTNGAGAIASASASIKRDATGPTVSHAVAAILAEATAATGAAVTFAAPTVTDATSGIAGSSCTHSSGSVFPMGLTEVSCTATDAAGNSGAATLAITVADTTAPVIGGLPNASAEATGAGGAPVSFATPSATDAVDSSVTVVCTPASGFQFPLGSTAVQCTATDDYDNASHKSMTVTVVDTTPPVIAPLGDITVNGSAAGGEAVSWQASAADLVSGSVAVICAPASGSVFAYGPTPVSCSATDGAGNTSPASFLVRVNDTSPPVVTPNVTGTLGNNGWYISNVTVGWITTDPQSGIASGCPASALTTDTAGNHYTCSATNGAGLVTSAAVPVKRDATPPSVVHVVATIHAEATSAAGAAVSYAPPTISDAMSGLATSSCTHSSGSVFPMGLTEVSCTATDAAGNSGAATLAITVVDTTAPVIGVLPNASAEATSAAGAPVTFATPPATDDVDPAVNVVCAPASGSQFALGDTTVTCTATDDQGNASSKSMIVTVADTTAPALAPLGHITVDGTSAAGAVVSWPASATDAVSGNVSVTCDPVSGSTFGYGTTMVSCDAVDNAGNEASASFSVTVKDASPPIVTASVAGTVGAADWYTSNVAISFAVSDAESAASPTGCDPISVSSDGEFSFTCSASSEGGTASATASGKRDATLPVVTVPGTVSADATSAAGAVVNYSGESASDATSGLLSFSCAPASGSPFPLGTTSVTCTATDQAGHVSAASFDVVVAETTPPVITSAAPNVSSLWPPNHQMVPITISAAATDNAGAAVCSVSSVTSNEPQNGLGDGDTPNDWLLTGGLTLQLRAERAGKGSGRVYTITVRCVDGSGNAATRSTTVTVPKSQKK